MKMNEPTTTHYVVCNCILKQSTQTIENEWIVIINYSQFSGYTCMCVCIQPSSTAHIHTNETQTKIFE